MYNFDGRLETLQSTLNGGSESRAFDGRGGYCGEWGWGRGESCVHPQENKAPLKHCLGGKFSVGRGCSVGIILCCYQLFCIGIQVCMVGQSVVVVQGSVLVRLGSVFVFGFRVSVRDRGDRGI